MAHRPLRGDERSLRREHAWLRSAPSRWSAAARVLSDAEKKALHDEIRADYDAQADPRYGAARLWIDAIIDPAKTREVLITGARSMCPESGCSPFNPGVLQT